MKIKWLGHASFVMTSESGVKIVTDPYSRGGGIEYGPIHETADIVTVSHKHPDHDNVKTVKGKPVVVEAPGTKNVKGIDILGVATYHDENRGSQRGANIIFCFAVDGVRVCHLGDLGHELGANDISAIGAVDVLMVPVGGLYTIDARQATSVAGSLKPRLVIPMHFKCDKCGYPITGVEEFLKGRQNVTRASDSEITVSRETLPSPTATVVLQHAL